MTMTIDFEIGQKVYLVDYDFESVQEVEITEILIDNEGVQLFTNCEQLPADSVFLYKRDAIQRLREELVNEMERRLDALNKMENEDLEIFTNPFKNCFQL